MLRSLFCITAITVISSAGFAQSREEIRFEREAQKSCQLIAMLSINYKGTPVFGAGIIVGRQKDSLLIATAYHLIHYQGMRPDSIGVRLKAMPDIVLKATILKYPDDKTMDLAVLRVKDNIQGGKCGILFKRLSNSNYARERGEEVVAVGNPNGVSWVIPVEADKLVQTNKKDIVFQSAFISAGNSGGGLLDEDGRFIGMVTSDQAPYGRAIDIENVLDQVKRWGYPVELDTPQRQFTSTPLHLAVKKGNKTEVKYLLENCADPNALDEDHWTPLHIGIREGNIEIISLLLKGGADIEHLGGRLERPLNTAIRTGRIDVVNFLLKAGASPIGSVGYDFSLWPMATAIDSSNIAIIHTLLAAGAGINDTSDQGGNALYYAVFHRAKLVLIEALISAGADPNIESENDVSKSPLGGAARLRNIEAMQLLVEKGGNINTKDKKGHTLLWFALEEHSDKAVDWLRAHGAKE